jgi:pyruvate dehydrogenase E2 component (dihydrolipoamide acetyltransferase)
MQMTDIVMPRLSDSMTEGIVVRWLKQPGETIRRGEPIAEIETDKATITYESDLDGVITELAVGEGQSVPVGTSIAYVEQEAAAAPPPLPMPPQPEEELIEPEPTETWHVEPPAPRAELYERETGEFEQVTGDQQARVKASPIARRLANKLGVDLADVAGSGPGGRVVKEDVEVAAEAAIQVRAASSEPTQAAAPLPTPPLPTPPLPTPPPTDFPEEEFYPQDDESEFAEAAPVDFADQFTPPEAPEPMIVPPAQQQPTAPQQPTFTSPPQVPVHAQAPVPQAPIPQAPIPQAPIPQAPVQPPMPMQPQAPQQPPAFNQPPQPAPYPQQPPAGYPQQPTWPQPQPAFPSPPPFVQGMTGNFPAISPQQPQPSQPQQQAPSQQPPPQLPPQQAPPTETATRGHSTPIEPTNAQQTVARRMAESKATAPEFFVETEVDMTTCVAYREQLRSMVSPLPSFNDFVIKASGLALRQYPNVNSAYKDGHFEQYSDVNVGIVVSATDVLAVPTLFNVDQKGLAQVAAESHQLAEAVRTRTIQPSQLSGGTFSISNLGMYGVDRFTAILNPPQAAILAVGAINRRAVIAEDGMSLVIRQIMNMTLTCDHRILYGAEAAEFLAAIKAWLESPQLLQV